MSDDKLTISFWIWAIFDMESNPCFDDLERRFVELKERGFNCIRLESGAGLCHDKDGRPRGELAFQEWMPGGHVRMFRGAGDRFMAGRCDPLKRLIEGSWEGSNNGEWCTVRRERIRAHQGE